MIIETLSRTSNIGVHKLLRLAETADVRYKEYRIPKRTGGDRLIEHPSRELKAIQRWIVQSVVSRFIIHESATAYRKGSGIRINAERHRTTKYTNRYDFVNFFPSFKQMGIEKFFEDQSRKLGMGLSADDIDFVGKIVCRKGRLTIGAPSSPAITNAMMFEFDKKMHDSCIEDNLVYTRYADDVFVSSHEKCALYGIERKIIKYKSNIGYLKLRVNHEKTAYLSKKYVRKVSGVIVTSDHKLSIGRDRKREIKSLIYLWVNGKLDEDRLHYMRGLVAFARDIEPEFELRIRNKYGNNVIDELLRSSNLDSRPDKNYGKLYDI
ncbi:MAG: retron St85 family RNA-directed DNA polymerase [Rhodospirillales bacterium]